MQRKRRLMREHADALGPEPDAHEILVLARGKVDDPVDATSKADNSSARDMVQEELRRVACLSSLPRCEEPFLCGRDLIEPVPVRMLGDAGLHARNVSHTLVLCKGPACTQLKSGFSYVRRLEKPGLTVRSKAQVT